MNRKLEIMAPAGSFDSLTAALKAGADSVYFGVEQLNMRARAANNFTLDDLEVIVEKCGNGKVKTYLTLNTILYDHDIKLMEHLCNRAKSAGVTAVIASDLAAISYAHSIGLEVHISTQLNVSNVLEVKFFSQFADVIVLARELTLQQVRYIYDQIIAQDIRGPKGNLVEIELFAHGALCVAISGKCYMSLATTNSSANRGACTQNCRKSYRVIDEETNQELVIDNKYIMSPKDLCTIGIIDKIIESGVTVFKLEGRGRSADYVDTVTRVYKDAIQAYQQGMYTQEKVAEWIKELENVYNRGFWHGGYYLGESMGEWSGSPGSQAKQEKQYIGKGTKYFKNVGVMEFIIETGDLKNGDNIVIIGETTGVMKIVVDNLHVDGSPSDIAGKGDLISIKVPDRVRKNDKLFKLNERK